MAGQVPSMSLQPENTANTVVVSLVNELDVLLPTRTAIYMYMSDPSVIQATVDSGNRELRLSLDQVCCLNMIISHTGY